MFVRIVSLLLIVAVIACPLACGTGVCWCCADDIVNLSSPIEQATESSPCDRNCCCNESADHSNKPAPRRSPVKSMCQGVCGGAVFEEPCSLDDSEAIVYLPSIQKDTAYVPLSTQRETVEVGFPQCIRAKNQGRCMRVRHMSFLC